MSKRIKRCLFALFLFIQYCSAITLSVLGEEGGIQVRYIIEVQYLVILGDSKNPVKSLPTNCSVKDIGTCGEYIVIPDLTSPDSFKLPNNLFDNHNFILIITQTNQCYVCNCYVSYGELYVLSFNEKEFFMDRPNSLKQSERLDRYWNSQQNPETEIERLVNVSNAKFVNSLNEKRYDYFKRDSIEAEPDALEAECRSGCNNGSCLPIKRSPSNPNFTDSAEEESASFNDVCAIS